MKSLLKRGALPACVCMLAVSTSAGGQSPAATPLMASPVFDVKNFGAHGDGQSLDTRAIQRAIDAAAAAGGGTVSLSTGSYLSATIFLKSRVTLKVEKGATLLGSTNPEDYKRLDFFLGLILADKQEDIGICGEGTIDGQGKILVDGMKIAVGPGKHPYAGEAERPTIINFFGCKNVTVRDITLKQGACWVEIYRDCENLTIENIKVRTMATITNDGLDIDGCSRVVVRNCDIDSEDDAICLKSTNRVCADVLIENCRVRSTCNAIKFGTVSWFGFKNITIRNIEIWDTYMSAIALELVDGGAMENVQISNIKISECANPLFIRLGHRNTEGKVGTLRNVVISDVTANMPLRDPATMNKFPAGWRHRCRSLVTASITGLPGNPVRDVTLRNVAFHYAGIGQTPKEDKTRLTTPAGVPECAENYPEAHMFGVLPAWALYCRHAEGIRLENVTFTLKKKDDRPALYFDDVKGLTMKNFHVRPSGTTPVAVFHNVVEVDPANAPSVQTIDAQGNPVNTPKP